jgi:hypothetical protein
LKVATGSSVTKALFLREQLGPVYLEPAQLSQQAHSEGACVEAGAEEDDLVETLGLRTK